MSMRMVKRTRDELLHDRRCHPDYEYLTVTTGRKTSESDAPPPDEGWEPLYGPSYLGDDGTLYPGRYWERFEYTEESYYYRRKDWNESNERTPVPDAGDHGEVPQGTSPEADHDGSDSGAGREDGSGDPLGRDGSSGDVRVIGSSVNGDTLTVDLPAVGEVALWQIEREVQRFTRSLEKIARRDEELRRRGEDPKAKIRFEHQRLREALEVSVGNLEKAEENHTIAVNLLHRRRVERAEAKARLATFLRENEGYEEK